MPKEAGAMLGLKVSEGSLVATSLFTKRRSVTGFSPDMTDVTLISLSPPLGGGRQDNRVREIRCLHH